MSYVGIPDGTDLVYYPPQKILGFKSFKEYSIVYFAAPEKPEGFETRTVCGCLSTYEQKMERHGMLRISRFWLVSKHNVEKVTKDNTVVLRTKFDKLLKLGAKYRAAFKLKMELALVPLLQLADFTTNLFDLVG